MLANAVEEASYRDHPLQSLVILQESVGYLQLIQRLQTCPIAPN